MAEKPQQPDVQNADSHTRKDIASVLSLPPLQAELLRLFEIEKQYSSCKATLIHYGFVNPDGTPKKGDVAMPSLEQIVRHFHSGHLQTAERFYEPALVLDPQTSFLSKVKALDNLKDIFNQSDTVMPKGFIQDNGSSQITGWKASFVDGYRRENIALGGRPILKPIHTDIERDMYKGDNIRLSYRERHRAREENMIKRFYERGINRDQYLMLLMKSIQDGHPIDYDTFTFLDSEPLKGIDEIAYAGLLPIRLFVGFGVTSIDSIYDNCFFRATTGGDTPIK